ncbi:hypothetical protein [Actinokineospora globicatena]|uniref:Uncharacterized protein n=1 Tax=Actinokineospora globicatena TaxID=103729 RepID=A0A9W6QSC8_9PSEU|nr:hypothetical protein [Actinokineospora globicatena]GLW95678.1 hypothetical protein Aglo03_64940 [Actinokineospora globicatena]
MSTPQTSEPEAVGLGWPDPTGGLNRPRRAVAAAVELVLVGALVWFALWAYDRGTVQLAPVAERPDLDFQHFAGNWIGISVAAGTLAALLLLDAGRQLALAVRTRSRRA